MARVRGFMAREDDRHCDELLEFDLKYIEKAKRISGRRSIRIGTVEALRKRHNI